MAENWTRLGEFVKSRREELRLTQSRVQELGGPSPALQRTLETGRARALSRSKRRDLERALQWRQGSIDDILEDDKEPVPASEPFDIPNLTARPDLAPGRQVYEMTRDVHGVEPLKLLLLAFAANTLSDAAEDFTKGDASADKLVAAAHKTYHAAMVVLAESLGIEEREMRETARQMGYAFNDLGVDGSDA